MTRDLKYALRSLRRTPAFTLIAALTLALGIGANTAIFSVFYGVLLRPLSYPEAERLVQLAEVAPGYRGEMSLTYRQFQYLRDRGEIFSAVTATTPVGFNLANGNEAFRAAGLRVSQSYFEVLGVQPSLGRGFAADEDVEGGAAAVVLSHGLWQRRFGGDPAIVGKTVSLDGVPHTVVGVMPADFRSLPAVEAWTTLAQVGRTIGSGQNLEMIGRLKPGLSLSQAQGRITATVASFREEFK